MAFTIGRRRTTGEQQIGQRDACARQRAPFFQRMVLAIAVTEVGIGPEFGFTIIIDVAHGRHRLIDGEIDAPDVVENVVGQGERAVIIRPDRAFFRHSLAEFVMSESVAT